MIDWNDVNSTLADSEMQWEETKLDVIKVLGYLEAMRCEKAIRRAKWAITRAKIAKDKNRSMFALLFVIFALIQSRTYQRIAAKSLKHVENSDS